MSDGLLGVQNDVGGLLDLLGSKSGIERHTNGGGRQVALRVAVLGEGEQEAFFAREGARVAAADLNEEGAKEMLELITSENAKIPQQVADSVMAEVKELGGDGGIILVTPEGQALYSFNTTGMYRGRATSDGMNEVAIFGGEGGSSDTPDH